MADDAGPPRTGWPPELAGRPSAPCSRKRQRNGVRTAVEICGIGDAAGPRRRARGVRRCVPRRRRRRGPAARDNVATDRLPNTTDGERLELALDVREIEEHRRQARAGDAHARAGALIRPSSPTRASIESHGSSVATATCSRKNFVGSQRTHSSSLNGRCRRIIRSALISPKSSVTVFVYARYIQRSRSTPSPEASTLASVASGPPDVARCPERRAARR